MIKMVVCDMDGTLLNSNLEISNENLQAIKQIRLKGIRFCVATGRPEQLLKEYITPLQMTDPLIMYNGSVIGHPFQEEKLYELEFEKNDIRTIIEYCEEKNMIYMLYTKEKIISKPNYRVDFFVERNKMLTAENKCVFEDIRNIDEIINKHHINKILLIEYDNDKYDETKEFISGYTQFEVETSQNGFIDINPKGASKGNALKILAKHFGYSLDEIVVFGNHDNDVSMLEIAGIGVVMANASESAKKVASGTTVSNNDNGVAKWMIENLL